MHIIHKKALRRKGKSAEEPMKTQENSKKIYFVFLPPCPREESGQICSMNWETKLRAAPTQVDQ